MAPVSHTRKLYKDNHASMDDMSPKWGVLVFIGTLAGALGQRYCADYQRCCQAGAIDDSGQLNDKIMHTYLGVYSQLVLPTNGMGCYTSLTSAAKSYPGWWPIQVLVYVGEDAAVIGGCPAGVPYYAYIVYGRCAPDNCLSGEYPSGGCTGIASLPATPLVNSQMNMLTCPPPVPQCLPCTNAGSSGVYIGPGTNSTNCPLFVPCPVGTFSVSGTCTPCVAGTFSATTGSSACSTCPTGTYSTPSTAASSCTAVTNCAAGLYANPTATLTADNVCVNCPANSICSSNAAQVCPGNSVSPPLSSNYLNCTCPAGYSGSVTSITTSNCALCIQGRYCPGSSQVCYC